MSETERLRTDTRGSAGRNRPVRETPAARSEDPERMKQSSLDDFSSAYPCGVCGREFETYQARNSHRGKAHPEEARAEVECGACGSVKKVVRGRTDNCNNFFCDHDCYGEWKQENTGGETHPDYSRVAVECEYCGDTFEVKESRVDTAKYCSADCMDKWKSKNRSGEDHHQYDSVHTECATCGEVKTVKKAVAEKYENHFCNNACKGEHYSAHNTGENSPSWKGGHIYYYGPSWQSQRRRALERAGDECEVCGMASQVHEAKHGQELHVHHIVPILEFQSSDGDVDYTRANRLENLVVLCRDHHYEWEGIPLRPGEVV